VLAEGPDYRLRRSVRFTPRKVEIADELTNVHRDSPLGLLVRHEVNLKGFQSPVVRLAWIDRKPDPKRNAFGTGGLEDNWADFRRRLREAAARIREAAPQVKILVYYDSQRETSEGGHERFRDSWLTDREGNQLSTDWDGRGSRTYSCVTTWCSGDTPSSARSASQRFWPKPSYWP
jgi:hypothetical protein